MILFCNLFYFALYNLYLKFLYCPEDTFIVYIDVLCKDLSGNNSNIFNYHVLIATLNSCILSQWWPKPNLLADKIFNLYFFPFKIFFMVVKYI